MILNNVGFNPEKDNLLDVEINHKLYKNSYFARHFLSKYIENKELNCEELNEILLKGYCLDKRLYSSIYYSNKENIKRLMRVAKVSDEFYLENIEKLSPFYNILKRNNINLKDDGIKLVNAIEVKKPTLEEQLSNKFNLSSKQVFTLDPKRFFTDSWHFNFEAIHDKYPDELDAALTKVFLDLDTLKSFKCYNTALVNYLKADNENLEEIFKNIIICETEIDKESDNLKIENVIKFIAACNSKTSANTKIFDKINPTNWIQETLNQLMLKIPDNFPLETVITLRRLNNILYSTYRRDKLQKYLDNEISQTAFEETLKLFI